MARRKNTNIITALEDAPSYAKAIELSASFLVVIDVYEEWCGPCTVIEPIWRKLYVDLERAEDRVKFFTMCLSKMSDEQKRGLPHTGCKPLFLVFKQKVLMAKVLGVNAPELEAAVIDNIPPPESE